MSDLHPDAKALFDQARDSVEPSDEHVERMRAALFAQIGVAAATATVASSAKAGASAFGAGHAVGALAIVGVVGAMAVMGGRSMTARNASKEAMPILPAVTAIRAPEPANDPAPSAPSADPETEPALRAAASANKPTIAAPQRSSEPARDDTLGAEIELMHKAQVASREGQPAKALALLDRHAALYPRGVLAQERAATRVVVLCALGRTTEARAAAAQFERAAPKSPLLARVKASCAGGPDAR
jgi:RNA polymerase sigma-70 factor (ECF subfamily)